MHTTTVNEIHEDHRLSPDLPVGEETRHEIRRQYPAFAKGDITFHEAGEDTLVYTRAFGNEKLLCMFNMGADQASLAMPAGNWVELEGHGFVSNVNDNKVELPAWGAYFARHA